MGAISATGCEASDADLVAEAQNGDRKAFAVLLERHRPLVLGLCRRVLGSSDLAEDAAQEACLQALLGLDRLREPGRFAAWLAGIGLNVSRHWLRQPVTASLSPAAITGGRLLAEAAWAEADPQELVAAADVARRVREAVLELPRGQRSVVVAFYLSGLTYRETAEALGIGVPAVKTRLHKGRASLRARLQRLWEEEMEDTPDAAGELVEMRVADVRRGAHDAEPAAHLILLEEVGGERHLPIWIGPQEGMAMAALLQQVELPRPMAPQFIFNALRAVGARPLEVRIDRLAERTFYAVAVIEGPTGKAEVDARPSDALNLALVAGARVTVRREVLELAADLADKTLAEVAEKFPESAKEIPPQEWAELADRRAAAAARRNP